MKCSLILLLVFRLSLAGYGEGSSKSQDPIQKAARKHGDQVETVLRMAKKGQSINGVLRPLSFLSSGSAGFVFRGMKLEGATPVAIKFINQISSDNARTEYEMYSYLNAINNTKVESYGIPTVHYYGIWKDFIVTAYTELEKTLKDHTNFVTYYNHDLLLLIKQFIKQSKYIHSRGVRHDDIKPENILTRGCESFLVDFDLASKMTEDNDGTTDLYASLRYHQGVKRVATDDWESFLYTICQLAGIPLDWFKGIFTNGTTVEVADLLIFYAESKANRKRILEVIDESKQKILPSIIHAFAEQVFSEKLIPDYDHLDQLVTAALEKYFPNVICFSWKKQINDRSIINNNINDFVIPNNFSEYKDFDYPGVDEEFFKMDDVIQKAIEIHGKYVKMVLQMAKDGKSINRALRPLSFLGYGDTTFVFRGKRLKDNTSVAIIFTNENSVEQARIEYKMYSYLNAINNAEVESYGISTMYYRGHWKAFIVTAYTELGKTLAEHTNSADHQPSDILLLIKQFIRQSKYIHSHGVRHDNINPENILIRGCESFLIDFKFASQMAEDNNGATYLYASLKYHQGVQRAATDDWESFLYTICEMAGIIFDWYELDLLKETENDAEAALDLCAQLKADRSRILEVIDESVDVILIPIIRAFAEESFCEKKFYPDYDRLDSLVTDALVNDFPGIKCFSWTKRSRNGSITNT